MSQVNIFVENKKFTELNPVVFGYQKCIPGHSGGMTIRDYYLIHYVKKGKGFFEVGGVKYKVGAGQIFILYKDQPGYYEADYNDPWDYIWIGFDGTFAKKIETLPRQVMDFPSELFDEITLAEDIKNCRSEFLTGKLFELMAQLFEGNAGNISYTKQVKDYVKSNYMIPLYVDDIAKMINLNRRYLSRIFKYETGMTIKEYITHIKMTKAQQLLKQGFSVGNVAEMVGYEDVFNFSKMYKKVKGCPPKEVHRKNT